MERKDEIKGLDEIIYKALQDARIEIIDNMARYGKIVSGKTANALHVEGHDLKGPSYFDVMQDGRKGGKVPYDFQTILLKWAKDKGITFSSQADANRWAYFTAKKIREEGTLQYRMHAHNDIYDSVVGVVKGRIAKEIKPIFWEYLKEKF